MSLSVFRVLTRTVFKSCLVACFSFPTLGILCYLCLALIIVFINDSVLFAESEVVHFWGHHLCPAQVVRLAGTLANV